MGARSSDALRDSTAPSSRRSSAPAKQVTADAAAASFAALTSKLDYLDAAEIKRVREAYRFADEAHLGQFRASGEPYITHPIAVAGLCAEWKLDAQAIMAALMHDAMEDCGIPKSELIERFGAPTADLVDGLTKLDKLRFSTREESQAESFRKMLLAMARDVRVILIKLADRLHNMRTMEAMAASKRVRIAGETLDIYAPIAHRLGLNQTYRELQELSFQHLRPWRHAALSKAVQKARGYRRDVVERIQREVEKAFAQSKLPAQVFGREKTLFSIYRKMTEKHLSFAQVNDIFGFRIVVGTLMECYMALGVLHQLYKPMPGRFKDYIAIPKANGYQSLHTTLVSPLGTAVEFQIRTEQMHAVAEKGIAAHWMYKSKGAGGNHAQDAQRLGAMWLQSLLDIQDETRDASEFLEHVKIDLFPDSVYVFTPKSKILALPRGATPVDFAYAIHSDVGDHCVAAKVNGEPVALRTELRSGDVVEIVSAPNARPNPAWLNFVRTGRARSKIRHYLKTMEQEESQDLGEKMLAQALRAEGMQLPDEREENAPLWQQVTRWSGNRNRAELLTDIGLGRKIASIVAKRIARLLAEDGKRPDALTLTMGRYASDDTEPLQGMVLIDGSEGASVQLAPCCRPIPGDAIVGYLGRGEGLTVHTADCSVGKRLFERDSERWMTVEWAEQPVRPFETAITVLLKNGKGVLAEVASAVASAEADITHIDMGDERAAQTSELRLLLSVRDRLHLADVMRTLKRTAPVLRVARVKP
ncbi:bifunctional (p)ppGpp synthetase/guanosine-3',5'-bis(diphosphate) 3'-pyrophosphohydrolase [uncultured Piscinibacter sp.]|uniref:RelA/SpoT family protein n=1 Tax=uncultured Piscinibacter sp. TaxID=1131835 RepID=UPI00261DE0C8|nr:bifunctional (p)ppGpp synthetase/guanosine-3',5'-bis(diphosphate) 3'-pyrophosphohydrolase [uncultured Piscinibacter sp.]